PEESPRAHLLDRLRDPLAEGLELVADHGRGVGDVAARSALLAEPARRDVRVELDARERARADLEVRPRDARVRSVGPDDRSEPARIDELVPSNPVAGRARLLALLEDRSEELALRVVRLVEALDE